MLKEILLAPGIALIVLAAWEFKFEKNARRWTRKYLEKRAEKETSVFLDPR